MINRFTLRHHKSSDCHPSMCSLLMEVEAIHNYQATNPELVPSAKICTSTGLSISIRTLQALEVYSMNQFPLPDGLTSVKVSVIDRWGLLHQTGENLLISIVRPACLFRLPIFFQQQMVWKLSLSNYRRTPSSFSIPQGEPYYSTSVFAKTIGNIRAYQLEHHRGGKLM